MSLRDVLYLRPLYQSPWLRSHPVLHAGLVTLCDVVLALAVAGVAYCASLAIGWGVCSQFALPVEGLALVLLIYPVVGAILLTLAAALVVALGSLGWVLAGRCVSQAPLQAPLQAYVTPSSEQQPQHITLDIGHDE